MDAFAPDFRTYLDCKKAAFFSALVLVHNFTNFATWDDENSRSLIGGCQHLLIASARSCMFFGRASFTDAAHDLFHDPVQAEAARPLARREFVERAQELADIGLGWN